MEKTRQTNERVTTATVTDGDYCRPRPCVTPEELQVRCRILRWRYKRLPFFEGTYIVPTSQLWGTWKEVPKDFSDDHDIESYSKRYMLILRTALRRGFSKISVTRNTFFVTSRGWIEQGSFYHIIIPEWCLNRRHKFSMVLVDVIPRKISVAALSVVLSAQQCMLGFSNMLLVLKYKR